LEAIKTANRLTFYGTDVQNSDCGVRNVEVLSNSSTRLSQTEGNDRNKLGSIEKATDRC
jgi:hypothetical protein